MSHYVITQAMPGYMPESDPYVVSGTLANAIEAIRDDVDRIADDIATGADDDETRKLLTDYDALLTEIASDVERAADLDESGATYYAPDSSLVWEATLYAESELVKLGYVLGEDFDPEQ